MSHLTQYNNPVISGFYPDPSAIRVGNYYYLATSSFEYFPGLPIFRSENLIQWEQIGHALNRNSQLDMSKRSSSDGIYAPTLRYHEGTFYIITTDTRGIGNFYITAKDPAGPWSDPILIPYGNIDPSLMFDDDGKVYVTTQMGADQESHIIQYEINIETGEAITDPVIIAHGDGGVWTEGPHLYKIRNQYYLLCACGGTGIDHRALVYKADQPYGPFELMPHPMLTHNALPEHPIQNTGHAELIEDTQGNWWTLFLGVRPINGKYSVLGRETFLAPVEWTEDGWPTVDNNEGTVRLKMSVERENISNPSLVNPDGNVVWHDEFDKPEMDLRWAYLRVIDEGRISLSVRPGQLTLTGNRYSLRDDRPAVFAGIRQQHHEAIVTTKLEFSPQIDGEEAGITVRLNERGHLTLGIRRIDGYQVLTAIAVDGGNSAILSEVPVEDTPMWLRISSDEEIYELAYSIDGDRWTKLASAPAAIVSSEWNGGFTGALIGLYATGNGKDNESMAHFDHFTYTTSS